MHLHSSCEGHLGCPVICSRTKFLCANILKKLTFNQQKGNKTHLDTLRYKAHNPLTVLNLRGADWS